MLQRLLTTYEEAANERIKALTTEYGGHPFPKVRLADVFKIAGSGIDDRLYRFALQSHFDFLVTDKDLQPLFAVEFDGATHREAAQRLRDEYKEALCERFRLPLLRINSRYLQDAGRGYDLLAWFVHVWFIQRELDAAQEGGSLPPDELFLATDVLFTPNIRGPFPLFLSHGARSWLFKLAAQRPDLDPIPSSVVGYDDRGSGRAIAWLRVSPTHGLSAATGMRAQRFPSPLSELLTDLAVLELVEAVKRYVRSEQEPEPLQSIDERLKRFQSRYRVGEASMYGGRRGVT